MMKRFVDLGRRVLDVFKRRDRSKDQKEKESQETIFERLALEERFTELWEALKPHVDKAMEAGKTAMEDPRAKQVAIGSSVLALSIVCYRSFAAGPTEQPVNRKVPRVAPPRPKAAPKPTHRHISVQWPLSKLIKESPHSPY